MEQPGIKVDKVFLSKALGDKYEILEFNTVPGSKPGDNYLSLIYSIEVKLKDKTTNISSTRYILAKCYPSHPSRQDYNNQTNMFYRELEIYKTWLPQLVKFQTENVGLQKPLYSVPYPPYVYGKAIDFSVTDPHEYSGKVMDSLDNFILMEDMKRTWGFRMTNRKETLDIHHMRLVIVALAKVHALGWAYKQHVTPNILEKFPFLKTSMREEDANMFERVFGMNLDKAIGVLEDELGKENEVTKAVIRIKKNTNVLCKIFMSGKTLTDIRTKDLVRLPPKCNETDELWEVIAHGDLWSNNMLFRYDEKTGEPLECVLLDLQIAQENCITIDLAYVIYASTDGELRKTYMEELLLSYHDTFNEICSNLKCSTLPGFTIETLKARLHYAKIIGFMIGVIVPAVTLKEKDENMEEMGHDVNMEDMLLTAMNSSEEGNSVYRDRVLELSKELYNEGVI